MNWPRYLRAMETERIIQAEEKLLEWQMNSSTPMSDSQWSVIEKDEELLKRYDRKN